MPIEIKELHIRVAVNASQSGQTAEGRPAAAGPGGADGTNGGNRESIIAECVEQVLEILQNKRDR